MNYRMRIPLFVFLAFIFVFMGNNNNYHFIIFIGGLMYGYAVYDLTDILIKKSQGGKSKNANTKRSSKRLRS